MTLSALRQFALSTLLLTGCSGRVVLAKDDPARELGVENAGGNTVAASANTTGGAGVSADVQLDASGSVTSTGAGGASNGSLLDAAGLGPQPEVPDAGSGHFKVLVFTRTMEFAHDSIPTGVMMLKGLGAGFGDFDVVETNESSAFNDASLAKYAAVVFLSTTGAVFSLDTPDAAVAEKAAFQKYMDHGGGYVGIHAAADTEKNWPWYVSLLGAYMNNHDGDGTPGVVLVDQTAHHPATLALPASWPRTDEWYHLSQSLPPEIKVLASLDEETHRPVSWVHELAGGGRMFYTVQGHNKTVYAEPLFQQHILGAVEWAAHRQDAKPSAQ